MSVPRSRMFAHRNAALVGRGRSDVLIRTHNERIGVKPHHQLEAGGESHLYQGDFVPVWRTLALQVTLDWPKREAMPLGVRAVARVRQTEQFCVFTRAVL